MSREWLLFLSDLLDAAEAVREFTTGMGLKDLLADRRTRDAVLRNLEVIGEAARHIPPDVRSRNTNVSWRGLVAFRNVAAHEYFGIDWAIVWSIVTDEIPALIEAVAIVIAAERGDPA